MTTVIGFVAIVAITLVVTYEVAANIHLDKHRHDKVERTKWTH